MRQVLMYRVGTLSRLLSPLASTSLQKERDDLTDILDVDPPFPAPQLWPGRSWLPASSLLDQLLLAISVPCRRPPPSSLKGSLRTLATFVLPLVSVPRPLPSLPTPARNEAFCLSFLPFRVCSQARREYLYLQGFEAAVALPF